MKRIFCLISVMCMLMCAFPANAQTMDVYLLHKQTGTVIKDGCKKSVPVAGLSHIAGLLVISEAITNGEMDMSGDVKISSKAAGVSGPTAFVQTNELISIEALYKSAVMINAGDALFALGEKLCGNSDKFVERMNARLRELCITAVYSDIVGSDVKLCGSDIAKIASALSENECFFAYSGIYMDEIVHENGKETQLVNPNRLIRNLQGCRGGLTGSSNEAGYCGVFFVQRNSCEYICVVIDAKNSDERFTVAREETEKAFAEYKCDKIADKGDVIIEDYPIKGALYSACNLCAKYDTYSLCRNDGKDAEITYNLPEYLNAPISEGETVGNVVYSGDDGVVLYSVELIAANEVKKATFFDFLCAVAKRWTRAVAMSLN